MYIQEDLVYDKHSGELIGFSNLGGILAQYEQSLSEDRAEEPNVAKTMAV